MMEAPNASRARAYCAPNGWRALPRILPVITGAILKPAAVALAMFAHATAATAQEPDIRPFFHYATTPDVLHLIGTIDDGTSSAFSRAIVRYPGVKVLRLSSLGGSVRAALDVADHVSIRQMRTEVPAGSICYSACAYIFLAGKERYVPPGARLGVHQMAGRPGQAVSPEDLQFYVARIVSTMARFGVGPEIMATMFRTRNSDMYVFTPQEVAELGINRGPVSVKREAKKERKSKQVSSDEFYRWFFFGRLPATASAHPVNIPIPERRPICIDGECK